MEEHVNKLVSCGTTYWKLQAGNCSFWWEIWLENSPLTQFSTNSNRFNNVTVAKFLEEGNSNWNNFIEQAAASQCS